MQKTYRLAATRQLQLNNQYPALNIQQINGKIAVLKSVSPIMAYPICIKFIWSLDLSAGYWILKYMHTDTLFFNIIPNST
jgi:hypothetical protein